jgi:hypothetical protein
MKNLNVILIFILITTIFLTQSFKNDQFGNSNPTIWSGATLTFEKNNNSDPTDAANQDRITNNIWITRGNMGGQIYNAVTENEADKNNSPEGTLWALGTTADLPNLTFGKFRAAVDRPRLAIGEDLVLLLEDENIAIDVKFISWGENQVGEFSYERSSK